MRPLGHGDAEGEREQALQRRHVLVGVPVLERHGRAADDQAPAPGPGHDECGDQRAEGLAGAGARLDHGQVPALARRLAFLAAARKRVGDGGDHLQLRPTRPETRDALAQRAYGLADQRLLRLGKHGARACGRRSPSRAVHAGPPAPGTTPCEISGALSTPRPAPMSLGWTA
ncbi:MAG: hypothetical protein JSS18_02920 [Proteobacteria bacterium]|nr:hypothetical protein [Pseudomonadota bacterium]